MFFELHDEHKIGYKLLSDADLGLNTTSHQTHIGLSESVLTFLNDRNIVGEDSIFIYENLFDYIDAYFDRIENPDGKFRSPKIKTGGRDCISVVSTIRRIVRDNHANKWYLLWFGLKSEQMVFFLFNDASSDYKYLTEAGLDLENTRMGIVSDLLFDTVLRYLEPKINETAKFIIKELEVASQVDELLSHRRYRRYDIDKANKSFKETGRFGEILIDRYLSKKATKGEIASYTWYNKESESGFPYDFTIENLDGYLVNVDIKTTRYDFLQPLIFSNQETNFIANTNQGYCIYRVYSNDDNSYNLRVCDDCKIMATAIDLLTKDYRENLLKLGIDLKRVNYAIAPTPQNLIFKNELSLDEFLD